MTVLRPDPPDITDGSGQYRARSQKREAISRSCVGCDISVMGHDARLPTGAANTRRATPQSFGGYFIWIESYPLKCVLVAFGDCWGEVRWARRRNSQAWVGQR